MNDSGNGSEQQKRTKTTTAATAATAAKAMLLRAMANTAQSIKK